MLLLINKPAGWTSFDAVNYIRNKFRNSQHPPTPLKGGLRVGHAGTLDPFATGLLIVAVGREQTKRLDEFKKLPKTYVATLHLGATSDTYDVTGQHTPTPLPPKDGRGKRGSIPPLRRAREVLSQFIGKQLQTPPMYSAKKVGGQRLYKLARQGKEVERQPNEIEIFDIKLLEYTWPRLKIEVSCSPGTYIRSLAHDIGQRLGVGAYCEELTRTKIGPYTIEEAKNINSRTFAFRSHPSSEEGEGGVGRQLSNTPLAPCLAGRRALKRGLRDNRQTRKS